MCSNSRDPSRVRVNSRDWLLLISYIRRGTMATGEYVFIFISCIVLVIKKKSYKQITLFYFIFCRIYMKWRRTCPINIIRIAMFYISPTLPHVEIKSACYYLQKHIGRKNQSKTVDLFQLSVNNRPDHTH